MLAAPSKVVVPMGFGRLMEAQSGAAGRFRTVVCARAAE
jgi:hypothetical protein